MTYLIDHFLRPGAVASTPAGREHVLLANDERLASFTFDHICNGVIDAQGEESDDRWRLVVDNNIVIVQQADIVFPPLPTQLGD